jgi:hypothetical protein
MRILDSLKNLFLYRNKYRTHSEAVIVACYFNPQQNPYRLKAFKEFYKSIKHLNHEIVECVVEGTEPELIGKFPNIKRIDTKNLLWHKESLLNNLIAGLDRKYKYVLWVDADVIFTNKNWLLDSVAELKDNAIIQPFEYCVHLEKDEVEPSFNLNSVIYTFRNHRNWTPNKIHSKVWRSFCANYTTTNIWKSENYDEHGHVGFAWGARRDVLDQVPLYDKALVGGADHIIAHAAAGQIEHNCITKSFTEDLESVNEWSIKFNSVVRRRIGYVKGNLYHIWHGSLESRQYLKRIKDFTPIANNITKRDENGLYVTEDDSYVRNYFEQREVKDTSLADNLPTDRRIVDKSKLSDTFQRIRQDRENRIREEKRRELMNQHPNADDSFINSLLIAYMTDSTIIGTLGGGNLMGAMIGDALNTTDESNNIEIGGSHTSEPSNDTNTDSENFS